MAELPTGTITFLFTDIEGSTRLLQELGPDFTSVLERHQALIRESITGNGGVEIRTEGDSFFCVFATATGALAAAVGMQRSLAAEEWIGGRQVKVRVGVHTGVGALGGDDYVGIDVNRGARIGEVGHGGQVLVSAATHLLGEAGVPDGVSWLELGEFHLKDLDEPEHLFQLVIHGLESEFPPLRKLEAGPTNLPTSTSAFVGREQERAQVEALLEESRLVTITGVAGAGKSRLAIEVASAARRQFPDGVWLVELASVTSNDLIAQSVAKAMGLQESPGRPAEDVLVDYLREGRRLLIFDNCEYLIEGAGDLATRLIGATPDLRILATSRQVLGTSGETRYPCPPLATPSEDLAAAPEVLGYDSVALFALRAAEVDASFVLRPDNAAAVAAICRRLDGMPLAIELAAALVRILTPRQILDRLDDRFALLTGGPRSAPQHQQTLRAALESTFDLLDHDEQEFAARLGVFVGGFDVASAEEVTAGDASSRAHVVDSLSALVDRSLVNSVQVGGQVRLNILESVREYLLGKLESSGQLLVYQKAHAEHFERLVDSTAPALRGPAQDSADDVLGADIENIRSAIAFASMVGDEASLRMTSQMFLFWRTRGDWSDGLHWIRVALENTPDEDSALRARMLATAGFFASDLGDSAHGLVELEEGLAMARRVGDLHAEGYCSSFLGAELSRRDTNLDRGLELLATAQRIYEELGESYGEAWVQRYLALSHQERGDLDEAISLHTRALEAFRAARDTWNIRFEQTLLGEALHTVGELSRAREIYDESLRGSSDGRFKVVRAHAYKGLGKVSLAEGKFEEAAGHLNQAWEEVREIGDVACLAETRGHQAMVNLGGGHPALAGEQLAHSLETFHKILDVGGVAWSLERLAAVAAATADDERAARLLGAGAAIRERSGSMRPLVDQPDVEALVAGLT
ncbi:MAG: adenylate/guanylate cyclase domain-containing protein, partial [Acidimicrobiia bacterium]